MSRLQLYSSRALSRISSEKKLTGKDIHETAKNEGLFSYPGSGLPSPAYLRSKYFSIEIEQLEKLIGLAVGQDLTGLRKVPTPLAHQTA